MEDLLITLLDTFSSEDELRTKLESNLVSDDDIEKLVSLWWIWQN